MQATSRPLSRPLKATPHALSARQLKVVHDVVSLELREHDLPVCALIRSERVITGHRSQADTAPHRGGCRIGGLGPLGVVPELPSGLGFVDAHSHDLLQLVVKRCHLAQLHQV